MQEPEDLITQVAPPLHPDQRDLILIDMARRIGVIEANTSAVVNAVGEHESRIRALEKRSWSIPGVGILMGLLALFGVHPH